MINSTNTIFIIFIIFTLISEIISSNSSDINNPTASPTIIPTLVQVSIPFISPNETENIESVTIRFHSFTSGASFYYSINNAIVDSSSTIVESNFPILLDNIGINYVRVYAVKNGMLDSNIVTKKYIILDPCEKPVLSPSGGTFAGIAVVTIRSDTLDSRIYYTLTNHTKGVNPNLESQYISNGGSVLITNTGISILRAFASRDGFALSSVIEGSFTILPKVLAPVILPLTGIPIYISIYLSMNKSIYLLY
jgi:hypothetical protein